MSVWHNIAFAIPTKIYCQIIIFEIIFCYLVFFKLSKSGRLFWHNIAITIPIKIYCQIITFEIIFSLFCFFKLSKSGRLFLA